MRKKKSLLEEFDRAARAHGISYAEAQRRETVRNMEYIRAVPAGYKKASEWDAERRLEENGKMLNERELDVLDILWKSDESMKVTDIVNTGEELTQSTVTAVLRKLLRTKMVEVTGVTRSGKVLSRTYRPTELSRKVILQHFTESYQRFKDIVPADELCKEIVKVVG